MTLQKRRNILLIVTDQERAPTGFPEAVELPNHERLRERGVTFNSYTINAAPCTPSRSVMYTGLHTVNNGMTDNETIAWIDDLEPSLSVGHALKAAGYHAAYKGKWHLSELTFAEEDGGTLYVTDHGGVYLDANGNPLHQDDSGAWVTEDGTVSERVVAEDTSGDLLPYGLADHNARGATRGTTQDGFLHDGDIAADAATWLADHQGDDNPWFLAVNFVNPHDVMYYDSDGDGSGFPQGDTQVCKFMNIQPAPDDPLYAQDWDPPLPATFHDDLATKPENQRNWVEGCNGVYGYGGDIPKDREDLWKNYQNYYINCVRDVDRHLGTVLDAIDWDNTVVIYTADHGEMAGCHGMRHKGSFVYKENVGVPFVVCHPDVPGGRATDALACHVDLVPTLLSLAGAESTDGYVGHDLSPVLEDVSRTTARGSAEQPGVGALFTSDTLSTVDWDFTKAAGELSDTGSVSRPFDLVWKLNKRGFVRAVFDGRYKFARYYSPLLPGRGRADTLEELRKHNDLELYDLANDPDEMTNLAHPDAPGYDPELVLRMNAKLNALVDAEIGKSADRGPTLPVSLAGSQMS